MVLRFILVNNTAIFRNWPLEVSWMYSQNDENSSKKTIFITKNFFFHSIKILRSCTENIFRFVQIHTPLWGGVSTCLRSVESRSQQQPAVFPSALGSRQASLLMSYRLLPELPKCQWPSAPFGKGLSRH